MSFLRNLFSPKHVRSIALLDINSGSVGGAYAVLTDAAAPQIVYSARVPIEGKFTETPEDSMARTLKELAERLAKEGSPLLFRTIGRGSADMVLAAIAAPWQETTVRMAHIESKKSFTFTKSIVDQALKDRPAIPQNRILIDECPIGTIVNGYVLKNPFGKEAQNASVFILSSTVDKGISEQIAKTLRELFHTKEILFMSGTALRYQTLCSIFEHEKDYLMLDASGPEVATALVKNGVLIATHDVKNVITSQKRWVEEVHVALRGLAENYPLPHTIFLIALRDRREVLKQALDSAHFGSLWLSDTTPRVIALSGTQHLSHLVNYDGEEKPDLLIYLMALHASLIFSPHEIPETPVSTSTS